MFRAGMVLGGRYRLVREAGGGGSVATWEARDLAQERRIALKLLHLADTRHGEQLTHRVMESARRAAPIRHPNVVGVLDFGVDSSDQPYVATEWIEGAPWADCLMTKGKLSLREAVHIACRALSGLAALHREGIVHRDLTPKNILLIQTSDGTSPKVQPFGFPRTALMGAVGGELVVGTPAYMSPEQACGSPDIDVRSDLYTMGVILYEAVAGRLPFQLEDDTDLILSVATREPPPLSAVAPHLDPAVCGVIERAMSIEREGRFESAREMRWALINACGERPSSDQGARAEPSQVPAATAELPGSGGGREDSRPIRYADRPPPPPGEPPLPQLPSNDAARMPVEGIGRPQAWRPVAAAAVILAAGGVIGGVVLPGLAGLREQRADPPVMAATWEPLSQGIPASLLDGGSADAGETVRVHLSGMPDGARMRIDGVVVDGDVAWVPRVSWDYRVEVLHEGRPSWWVDHPGQVDGEYQVWPMDSDTTIEEGEPRGRARPHQDAP